MKKVIITAIFTCFLQNNYCSFLDKKTNIRDSCTNHYGVSDYYLKKIKLFEYKNNNEKKNKKKAYFIDPAGASHLFHKINSALLIQKVKEQYNIIFETHEQKINAIVNSVMYFKNAAGVTKLIINKQKCIEKICEVFYEEAPQNAEGDIFTISNAIYCVLLPWCILE